MTDDFRQLQQLCAQQQAEISKLKIINQALIARVEANSSAGALAPYAAFQQSTILAEQVRERTAELHHAYDELKRSIADSETLRQSERWIRTITDNVPAMLAYLSADSRYLFTNYQYDQFYGVSRGSLQNASLAMAHGQEGRDRLQPYINQVLAGQTVQFEIAEQNAQGVVRHLLKSYVPHAAATGSIIGFFVLCRDITERKQSSEALRQANLHLEQRVQQRTAALTELNQQLEQAKVLAEQANATKTQFIAAVSHDVLQPLNAARLFNGALLEQSLSDKAKALTQSVTNALDDMAALLRTLVDLSRLEAGQLECQITAVDLAPLLERLYQEYLPQAQAKAIELRFRACHRVVTTDQALLLRVMRNLISNALRYTPAGGKVLLAWRRRGQGIELQVIDTGLGIERAKQQEVFIAFRRLANTQLSQEKGLGLGLAIVEKICALLQHPLRVASVLGKGSLFAVRLPLSQTPVIKMVQAASPLVLEQAIVWVLDNEQTICDAMAQLLTAWGYQVYTAQCADSLWQLCHGQPLPDLLIVDFHLNQALNGVELAIALKQRLGEKAKSLPVLLLTADHSIELQPEAAKQIKQILHKPVRPLKLRLALQRLLAK